MVETRAFSGDLVLRLDEVQYRLREGPCSAALQGQDAEAFVGREQVFEDLGFRRVAQPARHRSIMRLELPEPGADRVRS